MTDSFGQDLDASAGELAIPKGADGAHFDGMGIAHETFPGIAFELVQKKHLDFALGVLFDPNKTGGDDFGVIPHEHIAGVEIVEDIMEFLMLDRFLFAVDDKEAAFIAFLHR